ncbi:hypothetical protein BOTBODRAFT_58320 [Botryobasidium botryosum FD-172 SS1]|uniref:Indoleamine 2,3-dioxygenase n=1 Tax=Botryobasidium botryosum (strain FD-172 SS1) TaxID=930990 RepID=A0A067MEW0_BOTB1|nr:hypothetical protein BOTBODRAFT_58320 [Botryobasidium botryosum FD-172 SS1]
MSFAYPLLRTLLALLFPAICTPPRGEAAGNPPLGPAPDFDIDAHSGFMPSSTPIRRLARMFTTWEEALERAIGKSSWAIRKESIQWRKSAQEMPIVSIESIGHDDFSLRRAHVCLAFIMHIYVHSLPPQRTAISIPASIAVPPVQVSRKLGMAPILTYAGTIDPSVPLSPSGVTPNELFSRTPDEAHFYLTPARIELQGAEALDIMRRSLDALSLSCPLAAQKITAHLLRPAAVIDDLTSLVLGMQEHCGPHVFYDCVPVKEAGAARALDCPSAGQSTLIHALDMFLGVDHARKFHSAQRQYMPRLHRSFLEHLESSGSLRDFVRLRAPENQELSEAFNGAMRAMKTFRNSHFRIVARYIVKPMRGTGGTDLIPFLKEVRDDTCRAMIG